MANDEHVALLKEGVAAWNAWREKNADIYPDLRALDLSEAKLMRADLSKANLSGANLQTAMLLHTNLTGADLTGCSVWGISAWDLRLEQTKQQNLVITYKHEIEDHVEGIEIENEPEITVDNIEVAQFIYLLLHNEKIREVIATIGEKRRAPVGPLH